jgi:glutathionylspermidine synthase
MNIYKQQFPVTFQSLVENSQKDNFLIELNQYYPDLDIRSALEGKGSDSYNPYIVFDCFTISQDFVNKLRIAGENAWKVMTACGQVFQSSNIDVITEWGFPDDYVPQMLSNLILPTEMRFDIAVNPIALLTNNLSLEDFKVLEVNSATPSFWWETFVGNQAICEYFNKTCPNIGLGLEHMHSMNQYVKTLPSYSTHDPWYFCIPYLEEERNQFSEDTLNMNARMGFLEQLGVQTRFRYIEDLIFETDLSKSECLIDVQTGDMVKNLFLHYPSEWLIDEEGELYKGANIGEQGVVRPWDYFNNLILGNQLCKLPPIMADTIQNKGLLAFLWEASQEYRFDDTTTNLINTHFLPTYCFQDDAEEYLHDYWEKPVYGREGAGIKRFKNGSEIYSSWMPESEVALHDYYLSMHAIYQEHSTLPTLKFSDATLSLMFTVYVDAYGRATGVGLRASSDSECINAYNGLWYPLCVE